MLLENYESRNERLQEVMTLIEGLVNQILMAEMLLVEKNTELRRLHVYCTS